MWLRIIFDINLDELQNELIVYSLVEQILKGYQVNSAVPGVGPEGYCENILRELNLPEIAKDRVMSTFLTCLVESQKLEL